MYNLLIAEDEPKQRRIIRDYFQKKDFYVTEAADGIEALDQVKQREFDILLLDVMMPGLDGFPVLHAKVCALLHRQKGISRSRELSCGAILVNPDMRTVTIEGSEISMTPKVYDLLQR